MQSTNTDIDTARQMLAEHPARGTARLALGLPDRGTPPDRIDQLIAALTDGQPLIVGLVDDAPDTPYHEARLMEYIDSAAARLLDKRQATTGKGAPTTLYLLEKP